VEAVQAAEAQRATPTPDSALWAPGDAVALANGIFAGHHAIVTKVRSDRALVAIMMFGNIREVSVDLDCLTVRDE
jgi:transcription antitermination factor NusG